MYASAADYFVYIGFFFMVAIFISLLIFLGRRIGWLFGVIFGMTVGSPNYKSAVAKFLVLIFFLAVSGIFTYVNFYIRAYPAYQPGKVGAEVYLYASTGDYSSISIKIQRDEKTQSQQGAALPNGSYLLMGETLSAPDWLKSLGVTDGFRFYGLVKGQYTSNYDTKNIDINVSEKPGNFVWDTLVAIQEIFPLADIEKHYIPLYADGYNANFNVYVTPDGFKRD